MPGWLRTIFQFFTAGAGSDIIRELAAARRDRINADNEEKRIEADERIAQLEALRDERASAREHSRSMVNNPILIWPIAFMLSTTGLYYAAIVVDSVFLHTGGVDQMPQFAQGWAETMIIAVFGPVSIGVGATMFMRALRR